MNDPLLTDPAHPHNQMLATAETAFQILFTIEMVLKMYGLGTWGNDKAYTSNWFNILDGVIVVSGWVPYIFAATNMTESQINVSAFRVFRVLRPMRT